jgi:hypothetical protein
MTNVESFTHIADAIALTNEALAAYDALSERAAIAQATVEALVVELAAIRTNAAGVDPKARGAKFTATNSALSLAQSDLQTAQDALVAQKALAAATGKAAAKMLSGAKDALQVQRRENVAKWLSEQFYWSAIPVVTPATLATAHESVREIASLSVSNLVFELDHDADFSLKAIRRLDQHWAQLKTLLESEGVELSIAPVIVPAIVESKPISTRNEHGTLSATAA